MKTLINDFQECKIAFNKIMKDYWEQQSDHKKEVLESLGDISEQLTDLRIQSPEWPNADLIDATHELRIHDEAYRTRRRIRQWRIHQNKRKICYWNMLRNKETSKNLPRVQ